MTLFFRKICFEDLEMIMRWRTSEDVSKFMYTDFSPDINRQIRWFKEIEKDASRLDWIISVDNESVGLLSVVDIDQLNKRCNWAYYLASQNVRGKGVGREVELNVMNFVFDRLGMNKLCCEVFCFNELVINIHQKYGSKIEGTRREHIFKDGKFHDIVQMAIIKSDYEENIKNSIRYTEARFDHINKDKSL